MSQYFERKDLQEFGRGALGEKYIYVIRCI